MVNLLKNLWALQLELLKKPLSQNMLFEKFNSCIQYSGVSKSAEKIYNKLLNIEKIENCRELYKV